MSYEYDAYGNIKNKSDIEEYFYEEAHPNQLKSTLHPETGLLKTFTYDLNGSIGIGVR